MKKILGLMAVSMALAACGSDSTPAGFPKPAGTVAVSFKVDDRANKVFLDGEMAWKGSFLVDPTTRKMTKDGAWGGKLADGTSGWPLLYDDGPWTAGGHEPADAVKGDNIWGYTAFVDPSVTANQGDYGYGFVDKKYNDGWLWTGHAADGKFTVAAGATADIPAEGHTFAKFGTIDLQLVLAKASIPASFGTPITKVTVKGTITGWNEVTLTEASGNYTFTLSGVVGVGKQFSHSGLATTGDKPEFVFVVNNTEYKDAGGTCLTTGVTAGTKSATQTAFANATISIKNAPGDLSNGNSYITVP